MTFQHRDYFGRLLLTLVAVLVLAGCSNQPVQHLPTFTEEPVATDSGPDTVTDPAVTYKIESNGTKAVITYTDEGGSIEQATDAGLPWVKTVSDPGMLAQVSAQDTDGTEITCLIVDSAGKVLAGHTASGPYAIVTCQH
jgi:hypothetical protein